MAPPSAARIHRSEQQRLATAALLAARSTWDQLLLGDLDGSWALLSRRLHLVLTESQRRAIAAAGSYVPAVLAEQDIDITPDVRVTADPLVGLASDGRPLDSLLYQPIIRTKTLIRDGAEAQTAASGGLTVLERIVTTQVTDAARVAVGLETIARPRVGYVRMLSGVSCPRCVVLAGKWFRSNTGFPRHPQCDCVHIPTTENRAGDYTTDPRKAIEQGKVRGLSKADTQAILEDGADVGQVINAHRGLRTAGGSIRPGGSTEQFRSFLSDFESQVGQISRSGSARGIADRTTGGWFDTSGGAPSAPGDTATLRSIRAPRGTTFEGTTRRGLAGRRMEVAGDSFEGARSSRYRRTTDARLRPEAIYRQAGSDRQEALRLLRHYGYVV